MGQANALTVFVVPEESSWTVLRKALAMAGVGVWVKPVAHLARL